MVGTLTSGDAADLPAMLELLDFLDSLDFLVLFFFFLDFFLLLAWAHHWVVTSLSPINCGGRAPPITITATNTQIFAIRLISQLSN
jgi:hypothetical protein